MISIRLSRGQGLEGKHWGGKGGDGRVVGGGGDNTAQDGRGEGSDPF